MADQSVVQSGAQGASMGSVAGPWGAAAGAAGGVLAGLINSEHDSPDLFLGPLFEQIANAGANETALINQLPLNLQPLYAQYKASLGQAGTDLSKTTTDIGKTLTDKTAALYDPNGAAVQATLAALKQQDYSTLPGTLTALKSNLAATGGLSRGGAGKAITQAVLAPAAQYSQQAATTTGAQLTSQQTATQAAINKVASMDDATAQSLFGMSKEQAAQILQYGRQDLQQQLTQLINQSQSQTNQTLALQGLAANQNYQGQVADNAQQAAIVNGLVNTGVQVGSALSNDNPQPKVVKTVAPTPNNAAYAGDVNV